MWRPIGGPVTDWPLALCDVRTIQAEDMVHADLIRPGFVGENILLYFSPHYHFYFMDKQKEDEVGIFKQYDSNTNVAGGNGRPMICFLELCPDY